MKTNQIKDQQAYQLLCNYLAGDDIAFSQLYDMYANALLNYGHCLTTDEELVKDCVQDVFLRLLDRKNPPRVTKVSSYLFISLRNRLIDGFRKQSFISDIPVNESLANKNVNDGVEADYLRREADSLEKQRVHVLLAQLTPRQKKVFTLYFLEQRQYDEICSIMNMNYHSVRNLVHRGMVKLRAAASC
jgi:RNA polymerase sigma factor (sigma-70 family)